MGTASSAAKRCAGGANHQAILEKGPAIQALDLDLRLRQQRDIKLAVQQHLAQSGARALRERQLEGCEAGGDFLEHRDEHDRRDQRAEPDPQRRRVLPAQARSLRAGLLRGGIAPFQQGQHRATQLGELGQVTLAQKERAAQFVLESLDGAGERRLRDVALLRRPREVQ